MADPFLKGFLDRAAQRAPATARQVAPAAVPPPQPAAAPPRAQVPQAQPPKVEKERKPASAEVVTPEMRAVQRQQEQLLKDRDVELPIVDLFDVAKEYIGEPQRAVSVVEAARGLKKGEFGRLAAIQGLDVEDLAKWASEGKTLDEYRTSKGNVLAFRPVSERQAETERLVRDFEAVRAGKVPGQQIGLATAKETTTLIPGLGEGYEIGYTRPEEIIEATKPGEHQYAMATEFISAFERANPKIVSIVDQYASNFGAGASQRAISEIVADRMKNLGITSGTPDADAKIGELRREALYYLLGKKTVGQFAPGIFLKDVQVTDPGLAKPLGTEEGIGATARDIFATLSPNVELIGFNSKGEAISRVESPGGVALRTLDFIGLAPVPTKGFKIPIPGQSLLVGALTRSGDETLTEAALRGAQTGASILDLALDETRGQSTPVRTLAGVASLPAMVLYPDVTLAAGDVWKATNAALVARVDRAMAKAAEPHLRAIVEATKKGDYEALAKAEKAMRDDPALTRQGKHVHTVADLYMRGNAAFAQKMAAMNPDLAHMNPHLLDDLIEDGRTSGVAQQMYDAVAGAPHMNYAARTPATAARGVDDEVGPAFVAYVEAGNFGRHFERLKAARQALAKALPKTLEEAQTRLVDGEIARLRSVAAAEKSAGAVPVNAVTREERLAAIIEQHRADLFADPKKWFAKDSPVYNSLKADPLLGADTPAADAFRKSVYNQIAPSMRRRATDLAEKPFEEVQAEKFRNLDRAEEAVRTNIKARMLAAESLRRALAQRAKISITPIDIIDDLMEEGTEALSPMATSSFITTMLDLPASADRKGFLAAFQELDALFRGAAARSGETVESIWKRFVINVESGKQAIPASLKGVKPKLPAKTMAAAAVEGLEDVAKADVALDLFRRAAAGEASPVELRPVLNNAGEEIGVQAVGGDAVVRATTQPDGDVLVEVSVGGQDRARFVAETKVPREALEEGFEELEKVLRARETAGDPALKSLRVLQPAPAAPVAPPAPSEAAAVTATAKKRTPPKPKIHNDAQSYLNDLEPGLKATPEDVSKVLAYTDKMKTGDVFPKDVPFTKRVITGAMREELVKRGVLAQLEDGRVVRAGAPAAPEAAVTVPVAKAAEQAVEEAVEAAAPVAEAAAPAVRAAEEVVEAAPEAAAVAPAERAFETAVEEAPTAARATPEVFERAAEEAPAAVKAEEAVSAAPAQPARNIPVEEAPVAVEKVATAAAEPTETELQAAISRLEPLKGKKLKRINVKEKSFDVDVAGERVSLRRDADGQWVDVNRNVKMGGNVNDATEEVYAAYVLFPLTRAENQLKKLMGTAGPAQVADDFAKRLARVTDTETIDNLVSDIAASTLAASDKRRLLEDAMRRLPKRGARSLADKISDEIRATQRAAQTAEEAAEEIAPEIEAKHLAAIEAMRKLDARALLTGSDGVLYRVYGSSESTGFVPKHIIPDEAAREGGMAYVVETLYSDARRAPIDQAKAADQMRKALAEGQLGEVAPFGGASYANKADLANNPRLQRVPTEGGGEAVAGMYRRAEGTGLAARKGLVTLFRETADPTTLLHEGAHFIRETILDANDMDNLTAWLRDMGVNVEHKYGRFIGDPDEIVRAEENFAKAFEKYTLTGKPPKPSLEKVFEKIRAAFVQTYRWMKGSPTETIYGDVKLDKRVTDIFDRYFNAVPEKRPDTLLDLVMKEVSNQLPEEAEGALDALSREARRLGLPDSSVKDLGNRIAKLQLPEDVPNDTVLLEFKEAPVLGKREWTKGDILGLQMEVTLARSEFDLTPLRQALFGAPDETIPTERIFSALAARESDGKLKAGARWVARAFAHSILGGDIVAERGVRALPPAMRRSLDTPARIIEQSIGDTISVLFEIGRRGDPDFLYRFLSGERLSYRSGRRVLSSGHEYIEGFLDMARNQWKAMTDEERVLLQDFARAMNASEANKVFGATTPSEALTRLVFPDLSEIKKGTPAYKLAQAKATKMADTIQKFRNFSGSGEGGVGGQLAQALRQASKEGAQPQFNEYRFLELMLYTSGCTPRANGFIRLADQSLSRVDLYNITKTLMDGATDIYGATSQEFSRRLAILVGAYGAARRAKAELAGLGAVLSTSEAEALKGWSLGYDVSPAMRARLEYAKTQFGLSADFTPDTILGADMYIPLTARERIVEALSKAQFNEARLTRFGDIYQWVWTYIKKRMTRGALVSKQRYFNVNTIDHFFQMSLIVGPGRAAASTARLAFQTVMPSKLTGQPLEIATRIVSNAMEAAVKGARKLGFDIGDVDYNKARRAAELVRDGLSQAGSKVSQAIQYVFGVSKYRIEVNEVLEGRDKLIVLGGNVYTGKRLREIFVAEGVFASYDTRRLAEGIRQEMNVFGGQLRTIASDANTRGPVAYAALAARDAAADVTFHAVDDLADAWAERERIGAVITLMETGIEPRAAARLTVDALYDYSQSMTKGDRSFLVGTLLPFWAFQKNANQQFVNVLFSPRGAYRMMAMVRARRGSAEMLSDLYYGYVGGELGIDVDSMPQEMQDLYYAIMLRAHEVYGDKLPDEVRIGLRLAMTGRVQDTIDGKYYELDESLIQLMKTGGLASGGKFGGVGFADYLLPMGGRPGLPTYVRERPGVIIPQRRTALTQHYNALLGNQSDQAFFLMLPESSVETALKHASTMTAAAIFASSRLTGGYGIPGVDILEGGTMENLELGDIQRLLAPVVDLERSPVAGVAIGMYAERGYPQRIHPQIAALLQNRFHFPVLRVPAAADPFAGGSLITNSEDFRARMAVANIDPNIDPQQGIVGLVDNDGQPVDLVKLLGEDYIRRVQELNNSDIPIDTRSVAKDERFYLPPGTISLAFENGPWGEINKEWLSWEGSNREDVDWAGQIAWANRVLAGFDVIEFSPSKTAQQEEPARYTKTKKFY